MLRNSRSNEGFLTSLQNLPQAFIWVQIWWRVKACFHQTTRVLDGSICTTPGQSFPFLTPYKPQNVKQVHRDERGDKGRIHRGALSLCRVLMQDRQDECMKVEFHCTLYRLLHSHSPDRLSGELLLSISRSKKGCVTPLLFTPSSISFIPPTAPVKITKHSSWDTHQLALFIFNIKHTQTFNM